MRFQKFLGNDNSNTTINIYTSNTFYVPGTLIITLHFSCHVTLRKPRDIGTDVLILRGRFEIESQAGWF